MSFDWTLFLRLAEELAKRDSEEQALRSAVSRAYYAAYCTARARLIRNGTQVPRVDTHKFVWERYKRASSVASRKIGSKGAALRSRRGNADYDDDKVCSTADAKDAVVKAQELIRHLRTLP